MSIPPMTERGAIERLQHLVNDLREQVDYYERLEEKENCYMCHVKSVQFPAKVEKVREQVRDKVVNDIITLLDDLALPAAVLAIKHKYELDQWTPAKHGEAVAKVFLEQMEKNNEKS